MDGVVYASTPWNEVLHVSQNMKVAGIEFILVNRTLFIYLRIMDTDNNDDRRLTCVGIKINIGSISHFRRVYQRLRVFWILST